jgi:hypothetical protein
MRWDGESEAVAATLKAEPPSAVGRLSSTSGCCRTHLRWRSGAPQSHGVMPCHDTINSRRLSSV